MRRTFKQSMLGRKISKAAALKGLGDPKTWQKESEALDREFRAGVETTHRVVKLNTFGFSSRILNALTKVGISPSQTRNMPEVSLRKVAGIGDAAVKEIRRKLGKISSKRKASRKRKS